jgi:S1/P1 Nuclease
MKITSVIALAGLFVTCAPAQAWHGFGHMEVAAVAWSKLTPAARAEATRLIKVNPHFDKLVAGATARDRDQTAFVRAATWPDMIKGIRDYRNDGPDRGNRPPPEPEASQNIGYMDLNRHKYWHFVDLPFSPDMTPLQPADIPNAQTRIAAFRARLAMPSAPGTQDDDIRSYDLVWLLHVVGDVHQPLHATSRFTAAHTMGDAGGNDVDIVCGCAAHELHGFWDGVVGDSDDPKKAISAARGLPAANASLVAITDENAWINESFEAAKASVYVAPIPVDGPAPTLTARYKANALRLAKQRIALAGARLAKLLNDALR